MINMAWLMRMYPAFQHAGFRLYFVGAIIGMLGAWTEITAQQWLVYKLTDSAILLGLVGATTFLPTLLFSLHAGAIIDRYDRRKMLFVTQTVMMVLSLITGYLVWTDAIQYWHVLVLAFIAGIAMTLDIPARQAFIPELIDDKSLPNALNLSSLTINMARFVGPMIAALLIDSYGIAMCFFFNGLCFLPTLYIYYTIRPINKKKRIGPKQEMLQEIKDGLLYIRYRPYIRTPLLLVAIVSMFLMNFAVITPIYVGEILHGEVTDFGLLSSAIGGGSFIGAILMSSFVRRVPTMQDIYIFTVLTHLLFASSVLANSLLFGLVVFSSVGFVIVLFLISCNNMLQTRVNDAYRGRVMSVYSLVFFGVTPFGSTISGWLLDSLGPDNGILACSVISAVLVIFALMTFGRTRKNDILDAKG